MGLAILFFIVIVVIIGRIAYAINNAIQEREWKRYLQEMYPERYPQKPKRKVVNGKR